MSSLKLIAALLVAMVLVVFGAQNTQAVTFHFLTFKAPSTPMVLALFMAALLGALLGWIISAPRTIPAYAWAPGPTGADCSAWASGCSGRAVRRGTYLRRKRKEYT
jgi:hypothetical protein